MDCNLSHMDCNLSHMDGRLYHCFCLILIDYWFSNAFAYFGLNRMSHSPRDYGLLEYHKFSIDFFFTAVFVLFLNYMK